MFNSSIAFLELIKLYSLATNKSKIKKRDLKSAFQELTEIIKEGTNTDIFYSYDFELEKFLANNKDLFESDEGEIYLLDDTETIYRTIIKRTKLKELDYRLAELVFNVDIYSALKIKISLNDIKPFFESNKVLMSLFTRLAYEEYSGMDSTNTLEELRTKNEAFLKLFDELDNSLLTKLKIAINIYDFKYLDPETEYDTYPWTTILFSNNENEWQTITYHTVASFCSEIDEILDEESEEVLDNFFSLNPDEEEREEDKEEEEILSYFEVFLRFYLIYLNNFLRITSNFPNKETLIIKKYLLLSLPELGDAKDFLLSHGNINDLPLPKIPEDLNREDMCDMFALATKCASEIAYSDTEINQNPAIYSKLITKAIFIKSYLKVNPDEKDRTFIISLIINPHFYKSCDYKITTDIIDNLIFNDYLDLKRN